MSPSEVSTYVKLKHSNQEEVMAVALFLGLLTAPSYRARVCVLASSVLTAEYQAQTMPRHVPPPLGGDERVTLVGHFCHMLTSALCLTHSCGDEKDMNLMRAKCP